MDLSVWSAPVPQVDEHPQAVNRQSEQGEDDDHLEIQAVEEGLYLGDREKQCVLVDKICWLKADGKFSFNFFILTFETN